MRYFCFCRILFYLFIFMYFFCFKIFHNFFIYRPILYKNNRVPPLTNTKLHSKFQYNRIFALVIVLTSNVTDRRTDGQTDGQFESCSEFDYKHNPINIFSLRAIFTVLEKCPVNAIYSSTFLRRV